jgi:hypothetical protein
LHVQVCSATAAADKGAKTEGGSTALSIASQNGHLAVAEALQKA